MVGWRSFWVPLVVLASATMLPIDGPTHAQSTGDGAVSRVPEAVDYELVYDLDIPVGASYNTTDGVPYSVDRSDEATITFDRVAYYLELTSPSGSIKWAYASMRAFTRDLSLIGVPSSESGALWQQPVDEMNVFSNEPGVTAGEGLDGGNLEFWSTTYAAANAAGVPGASDDTYDWGDAPTGVNNYGSMQIHNHEAGETVLAYNRWGATAGSPSDIGIGNNTESLSSGAVHADWTFRVNASQFTSRRLQVLVRPGPTPLELRMDAPTRHQVFQRDATGHADIKIAGHVDGRARTVYARARPIEGFGGTGTAWRVVDASPSSDAFLGWLRLRSGWYAVDLRVAGEEGTTTEASVQPVGIGEVFITAGQSNSANSGRPQLAPQDPRVSAYGPSGWALATDPQPIATGGGGTPWPILGDLLAARYDAPIGFISVGWGGTRVDQWLPGLDLYPRLREALAVLEPHGARAVLWHQGESDASAGTAADRYAERLSLIVDRSRVDATYDVVWGIALVSFLPAGTPDRMAAIIEGQRTVIDGDPLVFDGPTTDDLVGEEWRHDGIHFNEAGLREHARRWSEAIVIPDRLPTVAYLPLLMP